MNEFILTEKNILDTDTFKMVPVGSSSIQPPVFPGIGNNTYKRNEINYTTIATKAAVVNKFEETFIDSPGSLIEELNGLPYLAVELESAEYSYTTTTTTFELPHRIGSGVFAIKQAKSSGWEFEEMLLEKMKEIGPANAVAYYDPISALLGSFLSHYKSIPSQWSKITGAVIGGCTAIDTQPVISAGVTKDPLGTSKDDHFALARGQKGKASSQGLGNIIHLESDVDAQEIKLNLYLNQARLRFYKPEVRKLLVKLYQYGSLTLLSNGIDFRNRCYLKPESEVRFNQVKLRKELEAIIDECRKKDLISKTSMIRKLPLAYQK